jgi:hypothetical protein
MKMKLKHIAFLVLFVSFSSVNAQEKETTVFHVWADQKVCITGEDIWVDGYLDQTKQTPKTITIRIVDRNGQTKSEVDVIPQRNSFSGFIMVPETLASDYYFLDCFAKGMASTSQLQALMVINPRLAPSGNCPTPTSSAIANTSNNIKINTNKEEFAPRSLVRLELELPSALQQLTVSAIKYDRLSAKMDSLATLFPLSLKHSSSGALESEGQVITVTATSNGAPVKNTKLVAALKGAKSVIGSSTTNNDGVAQFILPLTYDTRTLVITPLTETKQRIGFTIGKSGEDKQLIPFACLQLDESMRSAIEDRIFNSRVTNRFFGNSLKAFELTERDTSDFYGKADVVFQLDDYVRFPNMEEVISEIIPQLRVKRIKDEPILQILNTPYKTFFEDQALVLLDGVPVKNTKALLESDPLLIKSIEVVAKKYVQGNADYQGIVHFKSYRGDMANMQLNFNDASFQFNGIQESATFQNADHAKQKDRMPDRRNLLWRETNITPEQLKAGLKYYTSDVDGSFKIIARGLNANKELVTGEKIITVVQQ